MSRFRKSMTMLKAAAGATLILSGLATIAEARDVTRRAHHVKRDRVVREHYVVVKPRSFLDSGNVVPVGVTNNYVHEITYRDPPTLAKISPGVLWKPEPSLNPWSIQRNGGFMF